jgi:uncharacterized protein YbjT (DUF2867 family)
MSGKIAVVAGATGLVGSRLLELLAAAPEYASIVALARRAAPAPTGKVQWRQADFEHLDAVIGDIHGTGATPLDVFCCLGTTIKAAGSQQAFRRVDFDYVLAIARWARTAGARRFLVVSALGADPSSRIFYNRVKGEMEQALDALALPSLVVLRPSLLDGDRREVRPGERLTLALTRPLRSLLPGAIRPVRDVDAAATLLLSARAEQVPRVVSSAQMQGAMARLGRARG